MTFCGKEWWFLLILKITDISKNKEAIFPQIIVFLPLVEKKGIEQNIIIISN